MKKFIAGILAVIGILIVAICVAPFLIPSSTYSRVAENSLEDMLGRDVTLGSDPQVTIFPRLGARIDDVQIANAEGFDDPYFAKADSLSVAVKWLPLFSRRIEIASLIFDGGEVLLQQRSETENNWTFTPATEPEEQSDSSEDTGTSSEPGFDAIIPQAELTNMRVRFQDDVAGTVYDANPINLTARLDGLDAPVSVDGDITLNGETFDIAVMLSSLQAIGSQAPFDTELSVASDFADLDFAGTLQLASEPVMDGAFSVDLKQAGDLLSFANVELEQDIAPLGRIRVSGNVSGTLSQMALSGLDVSQSGDDLNSAFTGDVTLTDFSPNLTGNLTARSSNLRRFLTDFGIDLSQMNSDAVKTLTAEIALNTSGSITTAQISRFDFDDLSATGSFGFDLSRDVPFVDIDLDIPDADLSPYMSASSSNTQQAPSEGGWSEDPVDLSFLRAANGDVNITIGELTDGRARIEDIVIDGTLRNGRFSGDFNSIAPDGGRSGQPASIDPFFDGSLLTNVTLASLANGSNRITLDVEGSGITAAALVKFFTGMDVLQGVATIDADVEMSGLSIADFVRSMSGNYEARVADGAILGINLPQLLRSAQSFLETRELPNALSPSASTDFTSLVLQGTISEGVAEVENFDMSAPFVRATAEGEIDLYNQTQDIKIYPRAVNNAQGQNAETGVEGFGIPLRVTGTWTAPSGSLDTEFLANLATQAVGSRLLDEADSRLGSGVGSVIGGILGIDGSNQTSSETDSTSETDDGAAETDETETQAPTTEDTARSLLQDLITRNQNREQNEE